MFSMSVANVMPGDRIAVELAYSELLVPESSVYELVFPAVVGPRYRTQKHSQSRSLAYKCQRQKSLSHCN